MDTRSRGPGPGVQSMAVAALREPIYRGAAASQRGCSGEGNPHLRPSGSTRALRQTHQLLMTNKSAKIPETAQPFKDFASPLQRHRTFRAPELRARNNSLPSVPTVHEQTIPIAHHCHLVALGQPAGTQQRASPHDACLGPWFLVFCKLSWCMSQSPTL